MTKRLLALAFLAASTAFPASATIVLVNPSAIQGANVLFIGGTQTGATVQGATQQGTAVLFTGMSTNGVTLRANGGQASITGDLDAGTAPPNDTYGLTSVSLALAGGIGFNNLEFALAGATQGATVSFALMDNMGQMFNFNNLAIGNGNTFYGFQGIDGQQIVSATFSVNNGSVGSLEQVRLDQATGAVPEPATWAMMLLGFGAVGASMRRRQTGVRVAFN